MPNTESIPPDQPQQQFEVFLVCTNQLNLAWRAKVKTPAMKLVLVSLADQSNSDGVCWPGINFITKRTGLCRSTVMTNIRKLESSGFLDIKKRAGVGDGAKSNLYTLHIRQGLSAGGKVYLTDGQSLSDKGQSLAAAPEPSLNHHIEQPPLKPSVCGFDDWWDVYPKKVGKKKSLEIWNRIKPDADTLIADTIQRKKHDQRWVGGFIKDPERYLKGEHWNDELQRPVPIESETERTLRLGREYLRNAASNGEDVDRDVLAIQSDMDEPEWRH